MALVFAHLGVAQPQPPLLPLIPPGQHTSEERLRAAEAEFAALRELAVRSEAERPIKDQALDELARKLGVPRMIEEKDGRRLVLVDEIAGAPAYIGSPSPVMGDRDIQLYGWASDSTPNAPFIFQSQLHQQLSDVAFDAGWASFRVDGGQLQFEVFLDGYFSNFCGAVLFTDSRQATLQMGAGQFIYVPMCDPVLVPGSDPPVFMSCDGLRAGTYYAGTIPLNETLLRELVAGQGEIFFHLPAWRADGPYWDVPPPVQGRLLQVPGGDVTNALAGLPRTPRSLTAVVEARPIAFPLDLWPSPGVDVDRDGLPDFGLHGRALCTMSIPSDCSTMFGVSCASSNELLVHGWDALVVPLGTSIGPTTPTNAAWGAPGMDSLTSTVSGSCSIPWTGELGRLGEGYLGMRLRRASGDHYGWMRVRLPKKTFFPVLPPYFPDPAGPGGLNPPWLILGRSLGLLPEPVAVWEIGPVIEGWAYEPAPETPILAGARPFPVPITCGGVRRAGYLRLSFTGEIGRGYAVQFKSDLVVDRWATAGGLLIPTAPQTVLDLPMSGATGFYRVVEAD